MASDSVRHRLSFVVRFNDHFTGAPVADELPVRLDGSFQRPAAAPGGRGRRQSDGTYRFIGAPGGLARILWREPFERNHANWTRWDPDPAATLPLPDPATPIEVDLWPTADAATPPAATGVRGKLTGANNDGRIVRIAPTGQPATRTTRSDDFGNFLFLPPGRLPLNAAGLIPLTIAVEDPGGAARIVNGGSFVPDLPGTSFLAADFTIAPGTVPRVLFRLA